MPIRILCTETSAPISLNKFRLATAAHSLGAGILSRQLSLVTGTLSLDAEAMGVGIDYTGVDIAAFSWWSCDGTLEMHNDLVFSGGSLTDSGTGYGTLIKQLMMSTVVCTAYVTDMKI